MSETGESVQFAVPLDARCAKCPNVLQTGSLLSDVTKTGERKNSVLEFVYAFACPSCSAPCAFTRRAGSLSYTVHSGLLVASASGDRALLAAALAMRVTRVNARCVNVHTALDAARLREEKDLELLRMDRDAKYADDVAACAAATVRLSSSANAAGSVARQERRIQRRRRSEGARKRARCVRAALGEERAAVVRRVARSLQARGVRLALLSASALPPR